MRSEQVQQFKSIFPSALENEPLSRHTTWRIGGPARLYVVVNTSDELVQAVEMAQVQQVPWYVIGGGSNTLASDAGFGGVVIQAANHGIVHDETRHTLEVEAGAVTTLVARKSVEFGLSGFEWGAGLPGTIGGALYGNAGCYGGEMKDVVMTVDVYRIKDGQRMTLLREECRFDYRDSLFKHEPYLLLGCVLQLAPVVDPIASRERVTKILDARKAEQPLGSMTAGCMFKNPEVDQHDIELLKQKGLEPRFGHDSTRYVSAGWLIQFVGLMGQRIGEVEVSGKHANFFLAKSTARAQDVIALMSLVKMKVRDELGIELHEEVQLLGF